MWRSSHAGFSMITYWLGGTVLDAEGAARKPAEHIYQYGSISPEVATDGQDYLMAWTAGGEAWIRVIGSSGEERSDAIKVAAGLQPSADLRVVWNGSEYVAATTDAESRAIIVRISPSGRVVETKAIASDAMVVGASRTGGGEVLVLVRTSTGFATVLGGGPRVIPIPSTASDVSVASNGSGFLAVFRDSGVVAALPLDASGTTQRSPVTIAFAPPQCAVGIVAEGTNYLALWTNDGVQAASLDADGVVLARFRAANGSLASAAGNGSGTIILARAGCGSIASTFLPRRGQSGVSRDVSLVAVGQSAPAIVETAAGTQLFWSENALLTRFISGAGTLGDAKRVTAQGSITGRFVAALAGSSTFVIWSDYPGGQLPATLRAARFDMNGNLVGSTVITNAWFIFGLAASSNGSDVVVTWTQQPQTSTRFEVFAELSTADRRACRSRPTTCTRSWPDRRGHDRWSHGATARRYWCRSSSGRNSRCSRVMSWRLQRPASFSRSAWQFTKNSR